MTRRELTSIIMNEQQQDQQDKYQHYQHYWEEHTPLCVRDDDDDDDDDDVLIR